MFWVYFAESGYVQVTDMDGNAIGIVPMVCESVVDLEEVRQSTVCAGVNETSIIGKNYFAWSCNFENASMWFLQNVIVVLMPNLLYVLFIVSVYALLFTLHYCNLPTDDRGEDSDTETTTGTKPKRRKRQLAYKTDPVARRKIFYEKKKRMFELVSTFLFESPSVKYL